jgi:hypothetical protein
MMEPAEYCREIETYLCRKNEGHLIRIVGPAFEQVCGWAARGVPLKVAFRGIDQYCERYYAKGPRRRPVRIEFCEADILDLFDNWRRAVGVSAAVADQAAEEPAPRKPSLASHIERAIARLTAMRAGPGRRAALATAIDAAVRELDHLAADARGARGDRRDTIVARLQALDRELLDAAMTEAEPDASLMARLAREADDELAPFRSRMPLAEFERARGAALRRLVREAIGLPVLTYD